MFTDNPTEQTTAVTDLFLTLQCIVAIGLLNRIKIQKPMWTDLWKYFYGLLGLASFLGAVSHGIQIPDSLQSVIWGALYLALGLMMAAFALAAATMAWGVDFARRCAPASIGIALSFFAITQVWSDSFVLFVVYEAITMAVALTIYAACFWFRREKGSGFLVLGILVGIAAAIVDTQSTLRVTLIWTFDNHGAFHIVQMISLLLLTIGALTSHRSAAAELCPD